MAHWQPAISKIGQSDKDFIQSLLAPQTTLLEWTTVKDVFYGALSFEDGEVVGLVAPMKRLSGARIFCNRIEMDNMGPKAHDCPIAILELLTPTESVSANEWRDQCRTQAQTQTFIKSYGVAKLSPTTFTLDLSHAPAPHIALFQLANMLEQATGYWLDFREQSNGQVTEWMLMDSHGVAHKAIGTPRNVTIPLA